MYHKNIVKNQIWWLVFPLFAICWLFTGLVSIIFYQVEKTHYYEMGQERRLMAQNRLEDYLKGQDALFVLLEKGIESLNRNRSSSFRQRESDLEPVLSLLERTSLIGEEVTFLFLFSEQKDFFIWEGQETTFSRRQDEYLSAFVSPAVWEDPSVREFRFYLSQEFNYSSGGKPLEKHVLLMRSVWNPTTGEFLGSYGVGISLVRWFDFLNNLVPGLKEVALLKEEEGFLYMTENLDKLNSEEAKWLENSFYFLDFSLENFSQQMSSLHLPEKNLHLSFLPMPITAFQKPYYLIMGFGMVNYWDYIADAIIPFLVLSFMILFFTFLVCYFFMEIFLWTPINRLTDHIIELSSSSNFFLEIPEERLTSEIGYLLMQFKYFQKRLAALLLEMKNLQMQNISTQDMVFEKSSEIYFESKEVLDQSLRLESDNQFLNQFLEKFLNQFTHLFEISENIVRSLGKGLLGREEILSNWRDISDLISSSFTGEELTLSQVDSKRLREWYFQYEKNLKVLVKDLSEAQSLLSFFNQHRLELTHTFFEVKENLGFLTESTQETISFLNRLQKEVEELYFVQSQDLQKNRSRMQTLLRNI